VLEILGVHTVPYYGYGRTINGQVTGTVHPSTVRLAMSAKGQRLRDGYVYGRSTVDGWYSPIEFDIADVRLIVRGVTVFNTSPVSPPAISTTPIRPTLLRTFHHFASHHLAPPLCQHNNLPVHRIASSPPCPLTAPERLPTLLADDEEEVIFHVTHDALIVSAIQDTDSDPKSLIEVLKR
jgi:hypothetical protein